MNKGRPANRRVLCTGVRQGQLLVLQEIEKPVRGRYFVIRLCLACFKVERVGKDRMTTAHQIPLSCGCVGRERRKATAAAYFQDHMKRRYDQGLDRS